MYILPTKRNPENNRKQKGTHVFFLIERNLEDSPSSFEAIDRTNMPNPNNSQ